MRFFAADDEEGQCMQMLLGFLSLLSQWFNSYLMRVWFWEGEWQISLTGDTASDESTLIIPLWELQICWSKDCHNMLRSRDSSEKESDISEADLP